MPNEEWERYVKDPRTICKYGSKCYQKNPEHHNTYKHPPLKTKNDRDKRRFSPYTKKRSPKATTKDQPSNYDFSTTKTTENTYSTTDIKVIHEDNVVKLPCNLEFHKEITDGLMKQLFLVNMPEDFYKFYDWLQSGGEQIEKMLNSANLELVGPYDALLGKLPIVNDQDLYLVHWRFYYDPPELQTVLKKKGNSQFHIGYYRDSPDEKPVFLASNDSSTDCRITPIADNIFAAAYFYLQNEKKSSPFTAMTCQKLMEVVKSAAKEYGFEIKEFNMKDRQKKIVAKTMHGAGIVVPYNKQKQLGYRHLIETDANLKKLFGKLASTSDPSEKNKLLSDLQPVITYANVAVDECDFGTGLECGIALFCSGLKELEPSALASLTAAYNLLERDAFSKVIQAHFQHRRKGSQLSILDFK